MELTGGTLRRFTIVLIASAAFSCGGEDQQAGGRGGRPATTAIPVKVATVVRAEIAKSVLKNTTLEADRWVNVRSRRQGQIVKIYKEEGDPVNESDVIAELDSGDARLQVTQMEVAHVDAKRNYNRVGKIFKSNLISEEQYESSKTQLDRTAAQLEQAQLNLSYTRIQSPISGIVTVRSVEIGNVVTSNQVVYSVANFDPLLARIRVPEKEIGRIEVGQVARITVETEGENTFKGRVKMISPVVDPESGTIKVTVEIPGSNSILRPGMFASVYIITETRSDALVIPKKALVLEGEGNQVFVFEAGENGGKARRERVEIGFSDSDRLEVTSGLSEGDRVITVGQDGLRPGADIRIVGAGAQSAPQGARPSAAAEGRSEGRTRGGAQKGGDGQVASRTAGEGSGGRGGGGDIKGMQTRMFERFPEVKKIYDERVKKDPELATDITKFRVFIGEMREKGIVTFGGRGR
jgi:membrane fusion protein (multidrug efflux system)